MSRRNFSIEFKLKAVEFAEENNNASAARKYEVDPKPIRSWRKQKESLGKV